MNQQHSEIEEIEKAFEDGDTDRLRKLLPSLVDRNIPAAIRINASFVDEGIPDGECDRLHVEGMIKAAELGDLNAMFQVGVFYELGDYGINQDQARASNIFKELSEKGDPHCMWIYACELISGKGSFKKNQKKGLKLIGEAADAGSAEACMTIAGFYDNGELGYDADIKKRDRYRKLAIKHDETTHDPYV